MCKYDHETSMGGEQILLPLPSFLAKYRDISNRKTVCVDSCIVSTIKKLWDEKIITLGCCCGHGKKQPNVIIKKNYNSNEIKQIKKIIKDNDNRQWTILQWKGNELRKL
jgi:hypothetical protein